MTNENNFDSQAEGLTPLLGGRINIVSIDKNDVAGVTIVTQPEWGHVSVTPDGQIAISLSDETGSGEISFSYEMAYNDGTTRTVEETMDVAPPLQHSAWATGENHYMLEVDDNGDLVVEHGENHRKVHISNSDEALTKADIAEILGIPEGKVTGETLVDHADFGTEANPLSPGIGMELWAALTHDGNPPSSHWLLFEKGYEYDDLGKVLKRGTEGESELHPIRITSWGEGELPVLNTRIAGNQDVERNIVIDSVVSEGVNFLGVENLLISNVTLHEHESNIQRGVGVTIRDSQIIDVHNDTPKGDSDTWKPHADRSSGVFVSKTSGLLIEDNLVDQNGWEPGYDPGLDADSPHPPSQYSHNLYLQWSNDDVTVRDNLIFRGASFGVQVRSGGLIEDNVFAENNAGFNNLGGRNSKNGNEPVGNFSHVTDNIVTSPGYKEVDKAQGALSWGIDEHGVMTARSGNIVAHLANPDDPLEQAEREIGQKAFKASHGGPDDTIVWNWIGPKDIEGKNDRNIPDVDPVRLNETTIQNFASEYLGVADASIEDLIMALRADGHSGVADEIVEYFQVGFGNRAIDDARTEAATLTFTLDERYDGIRWDNRKNWDSEDLPGSVQGDSADLDGHHVISSTNVDIQDLDLGFGGHLEVSAGRMDVRGQLLGEHGTVTVEKSGQFWVTGAGEISDLQIDVTGGRFANTGDLTGNVSVSVSGNGQAILASGGVMTFGAASELLINGSSARVGFDAAMDSQPSIIRFEDGAALEFISDEGGFSALSEFWSGAFPGGDPQSALDLDGAAIQIDLTAYLSKDVGQTSINLAMADVLMGEVDSDEINVVGLGLDRDANLVIDYDEDMVRLDVGASRAGSGQVTLTVQGTENDDTTELDELVQQLRENGTPPAANQVPPASHQPPTPDDDAARKVHVSGSDDALGLADIAEMMGVESVNATEAVAFLVQNSAWGSASLPLDAEAGAALWAALTASQNGPTAHQLLFERGFDYDFGRLVSRGASGLDEDRPLIISAWGDGSDPVIHGDLKIYQDTSKHIDVVGLDFTGGATVIGAEDIELANATFNFDSLLFKSVSGLSINSSEVLGCTDPNAILLKKVNDAQLSGLFLDVQESLGTEVGIRLGGSSNSSISIDDISVGNSVDRMIHDPFGVVQQQEDELAMDKDQIGSMSGYICDCLSSEDTFLF